MDQLLKTTNGDPVKIAEGLGLPKNHFKNNDPVRVDFPSPRDLNLRVPNGREAGASDEFWLAGGRLPNGGREAVINVDSLGPGAMVTSPVHLNSASSVTASQVLIPGGAVATRIFM